MSDGFYELFDKGLTSDSIGIPFTNFPRLERYIPGIQKSMYSIFGGLTGSGKTAFVDEVYVLQPFRWWLDTFDLKDDDYKISWIYNSMERSKNLKYAKWACLLLYMDTGKTVSTLSMIGANKRVEDEKIQLELQVVRDETDRIREYKTTFFDKIDKHLLIYSGEATAPTIRKRFEQFAKLNGKFETTDKGTVYHANHPNHYVIGINDHIGKIRGESGDKNTLDEHSKNMGFYRDTCDFSPIDIIQFNRGLDDSSRKKNEDMYPRLGDFKGTANTTENADVALALFNPFRYNIEEFNGYDIPSFVSESGENRFRSLSILKNSWGTDDVDIGLGFVGEVGRFIELPSAKLMNTIGQKRKIQKMLNL